MVRVCDLIDDVGELLDDELRELSIFVGKELTRRAEQRELEAKKRVMQAIQDYLAAGYSLYAKGEVECEDDDWGADYRTVLGEIGSVEIEDDGVTLNFIEQS